MNAHGIGMLVVILMARGVVGQTVADTASIRIVDTELRLAIQLLGKRLPKPVIAAGVPEVRVTLDTPNAVTPSEVATLLKGLVQTYGLAFVDDSAFYQIVPKGEVATSVPHSAEAVVKLHVLRLKHARAIDAAAVVSQLFGVGGGFASRGGLSSGTLADELRRTRVPEAGDPAAGAAGAESQQSMLRGDIAVVPDDLTNSLFIRASDTDFQVIHEAVEQLDIRPLQVLIEVLIVEAQTNKDFSLGADLFVPPRGPDGTVSARVTGGGLGDLVINLLKIGRRDIDATIRAAQSKGQVEIVSRPVLVASNNTEARLLVGSQRPFVQVSRSLPTDTPTRDQVVQYRDVGTKLMVRPTINLEGYVSLQIQQEVNAATSEVQFDAPVISTREANTQVLVRDGQTIVIGGLRDQQRERSQSGVPILSGIPLIGGLFGSSSKRSSSTELYVFLTPRILRIDEDVDHATESRLSPTFGDAPSIP